MKRAIFALIAGLSLFGMGASASIVLQDNLDGSNLGKASAITYGSGVNNQSASFTNAFDYIRYDKSLLPESGTIAFYVKPTAIKLGMLFTSVGMSSTSTGDMTILIGSSGNLGFWIYEGTTQKALWSNQKITANAWNYVVLSYGSQGMKMFLNGSAVGASTIYTGNRISKDIYAGDYALDNGSGTYLSAFTGYMDNIRFSNVQSDSELLASTAAVPEPSALLALGTGLISAFAAFKRKRY